MCGCGNGHLDDECRTEAAEASRTLASERRSFLKTMAARAGGAAALGTTLVTPRTAEAAVSQGDQPHDPNAIDHPPARAPRAPAAGCAAG
jgi:hypothetical protein